MKILHFVYETWVALCEEESRVLSESKARYGSEKHLLNAFFPPNDQMAVALIPEGVHKPNKTERA